MAQRSRGSQPSRRIRTRDAPSRQGQTETTATGPSSRLAILVQRLLGLPERPLPKFLDWAGSMLGLVALLVGLVNWQRGGDSPPSQLQPGQSLTSGQELQSPNGRYELVMASDGNLRLNSSAGSLVWATDLGQQPGAHALLRRDGNFVVQGKDGRLLWATNTDGTCAQAVIVEDTGRAILSSGTGAPLWASNGAAPVTDGSPPGEARGAVAHQMARGEVLRPGEELRSPSGESALTMQPDGDLVLRVGQRVVWRAETNDYPCAALALQQDGNLVLYADPFSDSASAIWASGTDDIGARVLRLDDNGRLGLYGSNGEVWRLTWD